MMRLCRLPALFVLLAGLLAAPLPAAAQQGAERPGDGTFSTGEIVGAGHRFFGTVSRNLATLVENAVSRWGRPNGYILGQEGGGAVFVGLRYGEGTLYTKTMGERRVYWQGPSLGFDFGGDGARTMILVYNLRSLDDVYRRFGGVDGSAYVVGGFGMTVLTNDNRVLVPIRTGVGARLGVSVGYLHFTERPTWNPL